MSDERDGKVRIWHGNQERWVTPEEAERHNAAQQALADSQWGRTPTPEANPAPSVQVAWPKLGLSHYQALGDPDFDWPYFLDFARDNGVGYHRTWLIDAWAVGRDIGGLYDGYLPCHRQPDGKFNLFSWNTEYFDRLRMVTQMSNARGIFPLWTLWELYSWSDRKSGMPFVPDVNRSLFRNNVNGIRYGDPDDKTFGVEDADHGIHFGGMGLPDAWFREFTGHVLDALRGTVYALQPGNEMPEKQMHWRICDMLRELGYHGEIVFNRNEDGPGRPWEDGMVGCVDHRTLRRDIYDRHEFHLATKNGFDTSKYLDTIHEGEQRHGRPTTIRELLLRVDPSRIIISSDGDGGAIVPEQTPLAIEVLRMGASFERQCNLKRNRFYGDGTLRMDDLNAEVPLMRAIKEG